MPIFDIICPACQTMIKDKIIFPNDAESDRIFECPECKHYIDPVFSDKAPGAPSFKIKGLRAANGYGLKFMDTYGKSKIDDHESGYSYTSKAGTVDHNQGQERKV